MNGLTSYRTTRKKENEEKLGDQSDAFHDTVNPLDAVSRAHSDVKRRVLELADGRLMDMCKVLMDITDRLLRSDPIERHLDGDRVDSLRDLLPGVTHVSPAGLTKDVTMQPSRTMPPADLIDSPWEESGAESSAARQLIRDLAEISHESISVSTQNSYSILNSIKSQLEDWFNESWIWCPLRDRLHELKPNQCRLYWTCVRRDGSQSQRLHGTNYILGLRRTSF